MNRMASKILMLAMAGLMLLPVAASATWPGVNGKIFFSCRVGGTGSTGRTFASSIPTARASTI